MNQRQLEYFLEVLKYKSIKKAAEQLLISPQGMSKTILGLEEELQEKLFERDGKHLLPTPAAIILKQHAQKILDEFRLIQNKEYLSLTRKTPLKVLTSYDVLRYLTVDFIKDFRNTHPDILLVITETTDKMALQMLLDDEAEIALFPGPIEDNLFSTKHLYSSRYCIMANLSHPLAQKSAINLEDLHQQPLAIRGREFSLYHMHQNILAQHGVEPVNVIETSSYYMIHRMAEANICLGATLDYIAFSDPQPHTVILPFTDSQMIKNFYLVQKKESKLTENAHLFKIFLLSWINENKNQLFHWSKADPP